MCRVCFAFKLVIPQCRLMIDWVVLPLKFSSCCCLLALKLNIFSLTLACVLKAEQED